MKSKKLVEWLGFADPPDFSKSKSIGRFLGFAISFFAIFYVIFCAYLFLDMLRAVFHVHPYNSDNRGAELRGMGLLLAALIGAPFVIWRTNSAAKQARISEEALFNQRYEAASVGLAARRETTRVVDVKDEAILREIEDDLVQRLSGSML